jgi:hypothetical protein
VGDSGGVCGILKEKCNLPNLILVYLCVGPGF